MIGAGGPSTWLVDEDEGMDVQVIHQTQQQQQQQPKQVEPATGVLCHQSQPNVNLVHNVEGLRDVQVLSVLRDDNCYSVTLLPTFVGAKPPIYVKNPNFLACA